ncbi:MAG: hypothetical protein ALECFALPRED_006157 [Alectoria fallacina]|uniref:Uncharacterized protein n=1 Tax=Alectoria fallacina TaxID=1903189 RepID=A0A8H3G591_9LECA|nr:MAG: hypothetical protein ALECFALPRED_006157 [Alectoria fallacina]
MDFNLHSKRFSSTPTVPSSLYSQKESNSTYYSDLDIARTHLLCTLFSVGIDQARHKHGNGVVNIRQGSFTIKLAAVKCSFKREIRPYERYEMWTRVLTWETKWLYTITHFIRKDAQNNDSIVCATAISKCVFKSGRRTIPPEVMLHASGLLPQEVFAKPVRPTAVRHHTTLGRVPQLKDGGILHKFHIEPTTPTVQRSEFLDGDEWMGRQGKESQSGGWTAERIESERQRGMGVVNVEDLDLMHDFLADVDVLARHFDL